MIATREQLLAFFDLTAGSCRAIMDAKNHDYATTDAGGSPFDNFVASEKLGICATEIGFLVRILDKIQRLKTYALAGRLAVPGEGVNDALHDIINYCILLKGYLANKETGDE